MDYLQEDYYPASTSNHPIAAPLSQVTPLEDPTTPAQPPRNDISYGPPDSITSTNLADTSPLHDPTDAYSGMPPPPPSTYPTLADLMTACQLHARNHGYACVTSSNNHKRGIAYVRCDRGGQYANHWNLTPETRTRHNRTRRLVGCTWKARAKRLKTGEWELRMMEDKHSGHGRSGDAKAHPSLRKLDSEAVAEAKRMFGEGRGPKEVLEVLRRWNASVTAQDVYNLKAKIAREKEGGGGGISGGASKGRVRKAGGTGVGENSGASAEGAVAVDPALQEQQQNGTSPSNINGGRAPAARMQDVDMQIEVMGANGAGAGATTGATPTQKGKCACKCCDH